MLTIEPYNEPTSAADGKPAYTLAHTGVQILVASVDGLTLREVEARAWTVNPNTETVQESIWGHIWIDRLVSGPIPAVEVYAALAGEDDDIDAYLADDAMFGPEDIDDDNDED